MVDDRRPTSRCQARVQAIYQVACPRLKTTPPLSGDHTGTTSSGPAGEVAHVGPVWQCGNCDRARLGAWFARARGHSEPAAIGTDSWIGRRPARVRSNDSLAFVVTRRYLQELWIEPKRSPRG